MKSIEILTNEIYLYLLFPKLFQALKGKLYFFYSYV